MSLQAVTAIGVHLGTFRNVDLPRRGLYHIRCSLSSETDGGKSRCVPHVFPPSMPRDKRVLMQSLVLERDLAFQSRSINICYHDEEVPINDVVQFFVEEDGGSPETIYTFEMDLMYADIASPPTLDQSASGATFVANFTNRSVSTESIHSLVPSDWESVCTKKVRLSKVSSGIHTYYPCDFGAYNFFCRLEVMVHSSLLDFRFRIPPVEHLSGYSRPSGYRWPATGDRVRRPSMYEAFVKMGARADGRAPPEEPPREKRLCDSGPPQEAPPRRPPEEDSGKLATAVVCTQREYTGRLVAARKKLSMYVDSIAEVAALESPQLSPEGTPVTTPRITPRASALDFLASRRSKGSSPTSKVMAPGGDGCDLHSDTDSMAPDSSCRGGGRPAAAARCLAEDFSRHSAQVATVWHLLWEMSSHASVEIRDMLHKAWIEETLSSWSHHIVRSVLHSGQIFDCRQEDMPTEHFQRAAEVQSVRAGPYCLSYPIQEADIPPAEPFMPIIFEETFQNNEDRPQAPSSPAPSTMGTSMASAAAAAVCSGAHVLVLVHGFQGKSFDMLLLKNYISVRFPTALYLCSTANEDNTEADIEEMGVNLANEVIGFLREWCPGTPPFGNQDTPRTSPMTEALKGLELRRLSFVCHSIGGLIARAALPLLAHSYGTRFFTFMTLSSPHLGYIYAPTSAFRTGLWFAKKLRQSRCLEQLSMTDEADPEDSFLVRLSKQPGLELFQRVVLLGSHQDQYAPFGSARLEMTSAAREDKKLGPLYASMLHNVLGPVEPERVMRLNIHFSIAEKSLDTMIGRAAHVQFLENRQLMSMIAHMYSYLFE